MSLKSQGNLVYLYENSQVLKLLKDHEKEWRRNNVMQQEEIFLLAKFGTFITCSVFEPCCFSESRLLMDGT